MTFVTEYTYLLQWRHYHWQRRLQANDHNRSRVRRITPILQRPDRFHIFRHLVQQMESRRNRRANIGSKLPNNQHMLNKKIIS